MMNTKVRRLVIWIPLALLIILLSVFVILLFPRLFTPEPQLDYLQYGNNLSTIDIYNSENQVVELDTNKHKLIFFVASDCSSCVEELAEFSKFQRIFSENQPIQFMLLWESDIPTREVEQYGLNEYSYSLNNTKIASTYSTAIMADKDNRVIFVNGSGFDNTIKYLFESDFLELNKDILISNTNDYIVDTYSTNQGKDTLIYFSLPGCPDCAEATPIVETDEVTQKYEIIRIEVDKGADVGDIIDYHDIYGNVYGIDWYPSFSILSGDSWRMIRKVEISELKYLLLQP